MTTIGERLYDIDVIEGIVALMQLRNEQMGEPDGPPKPEHQETLIRIQVRAPLNGVGQSLPAASMTRDVSLGEVRGLSDSERGRLSVTGAGAYVSFAEDWPAEVHGADDFRTELVAYMRAEGRRLFPWWKLIAIAPVVAALALVVVWVVELAVGGLDGLLVTFGSILAVGAFAAAIAASGALLRKGAARVRTHRFRGGTRAEFRTAVTNIKAGAITTGAGTLLGVILTLLFEKVTGICLG